MKLSAVLLFLFLTVVSYAQQALTFTIKPSYSFTRVTSDLKNHMKRSGFGDESPPNWFSSSAIAHPKTDRIGVGVIVELEVLANKNLSFSLAGGLPDWGEVHGYDNIGIGNYLFLEYATWMANATLNYHYFSHKASIGPALAFFNYKETQADQGENVKETKKVAGISLSNSFFSQRKRKVKIGLFFQANVFPDIKTKEITVSHTLGVATSTPETFTSTFKAADVNISNLQVGLAIEF